MTQPIYETDYLAGFEHVSQALREGLQIGPPRDHSWILGGCCALTHFVIDQSDFDPSLRDLAQALFLVLNGALGDSEGFQPHVIDGGRA